MTDQIIFDLNDHTIKDISGNSTELNSSLESNQSKSCSAQNVENFSYSKIITGKDKLLSESSLQGIPDSIAESANICNKWYELLQTNQIDLNYSSNDVQKQIPNLKQKPKYNKREKEKTSETIPKVKKNYTKSQSKITKNHK